MPSPLTPLRTLTHVPLHLRLRLRPQLRSASTITKDWQGRQSSEHVANRKDGLDIQSAASNAGQEDRSKGVSGESEGGHSQATTEKDRGNQNEQAQRDHPEAPGPVIGMNDERGKMGHKP